MLELTVVSVGKTKEGWLEAALDEYIRRLRSQIKVHQLWVKGDQQLEEAVERFSTLICLDPKGKMLDSPEFARHLQKMFERGGSRLALVIGGPEGLPQRLREEHSLISLSPLTFTHQIARLVLLEQVYRATEIWRGSPYHK